jgi:hypothetical protein
VITEPQLVAAIHECERQLAHREPRAVANRQLPLLGRDGFQLAEETLNRNVHTIAAYHSRPHGHGERLVVAASGLADGSYVAVSLPQLSQGTVPADDA